MTVATSLHSHVFLSLAHCSAGMLRATWSWLLVLPALTTGFWNYGYGGGGHKKHSGGSAWSKVGWHSSQTTEKSPDMHEIQPITMTINGPGVSYDAEDTNAFQMLEQEGDKEMVKAWEEDAGFQMFAMLTNDDSDISDGMITAVIEELGNREEKMEQLKKEHEDVEQKKIKVIEDIAAEVIEEMTSKDLTVAEINAELADVLVEGDIMPYIDSARKKRKMLATEAKLWTDRKVPYVFEADFPYENEVMEGINYYMENTCVDIVPRSSEENYVEIVQQTGCWSMGPGMTGAGKQLISIGEPGCTYFGKTTHELGHTLGLFHEQARRDRDSVVQIDFPNVQSGSETQFSRVTEGATQFEDVVEYDFGSTMHYGPSFFAIDRSVPNLIPYDALYQQTIGNIETATFSDIKILNLGYQCASLCTSTPACSHGGFVHPRDCSKCLCPTGFGGDLCDAPAVSTAQMSEPCGGILMAEPTWKTLDHLQSYKEVGDCVWHIMSGQENNMVELYLDELTVEAKYAAPYCIGGCNFRGYLEVKTGKSNVQNNVNFERTGYRFCCDIEPFRFDPVTNKAIIMSHVNDRSVHFKLHYRIYSTMDIEPGLPNYNTEACADTHWSDWSDDGECSASCGGKGRRKNTRSCVGESEMCKCSGYDSQLMTCPSVPCFDDPEPCRTTGFEYRKIDSLSIPIGCASVISED